MTRMRLWSLLVLFGSFALACVPGEEPPAVDSCELSPGGICTFAGTGAPGFDGDGQPLLESRFYWPVDMTITSTGDFYVLDWNNHRLRRVTDEGTFETLVGTDFVGDGPDDQSDLTPEGADGLTVNLNHPTQVRELADGQLLLVSWHNHKLRTVDPATGVTRVLCGRGAGFQGDGEEVTGALLNQPSSVAVADDGSFYILDQRNQRIRRVGPDGIIETVAGTGERGFAGDGGDPLAAQFNFPTGSNPPPNGSMTLDDEGRLYLADSLNHRIRRIDFDVGLIETVAGTGEAGFSGDGSAAVEAAIHNPRDLELGPDGRLYFADERNHRVRAIDLETGVIETVAGNGEAGFAGDGAAASAASLNEPAGLAFDADGNLYIADTSNHRIRIVGAQP